MKKNPRKLWKHINSIINRKTQSDNINIIHDNTELTQENAANHFNQYFTSVPISLLNAIPSVDIPFHIYSPRVSNDFNFTVVSTDDVREGILSFRNKKFYEHEIQISLLLSVVDTISSVFSDIIKKAAPFSTCYYPDCVSCHSNLQEWR